MCPIPYTLLIYHLYISCFLYVKKIQTKNNAAVQTYQAYINWLNKFSINNKDILREIHLKEKLHFRHNERICCREKSSAGVFLRRYSDIKPFYATDLFLYPRKT